MLCGRHTIFVAYIHWYDWLCFGNEEYVSLTVMSRLLVLCDWNREKWIKFWDLSMKLWNKSHSISPIDSIAFHRLDRIIWIFEIAPTSCTSPIHKITNRHRIKWRNLKLKSHQMHSRLLTHTHTQTYRQIVLNQMLICKLLDTI